LADGLASKNSETDILDNPSAANFEELGEMYLDEKKFEKSRGAFTKAIAPRSDSPHTFYLRGKASVGLNDLAGAIADLEIAVRSDHKFDYYRAAGILANAYAHTGDYARADTMFAERSSSPTRRRRFTTTQDF